MKWPNARGWLRAVSAVSALVVIANLVAFAWVVRHDTRVDRYPGRQSPIALDESGVSARLQLGPGIDMSFRRIDLTSENRSLWVAVHETTQAQFAVFADETGHRTLAERDGYAWTVAESGFARAPGVNWRTAGRTESAETAVTMVAWPDAASFASWLSSSTGLSVRLPTTPEWVAICRAGHPSVGEAADDLNKYAWFNNAVAGPQPVGGKAPDALGLFDLMGNVWEWHSGSSLWDIRSRRLAGGSWLNGPSQLRCDSTPSERAAIREPHIGFRVVIDAPFVVAVDHTDDPTGAGSYVFDLSPLYATPTAWRQEFERVRNDVTMIRGIARSLGRGPRALADGLDQVADLRTRAGKLALYGTLINLIDSNSADARATYDAGTAIEAQTEAAVAFVDREILAIGVRRLDEWQRAEPRLRRHAWRIRRTLEMPRLGLETVGLEASRLMRRWPQLAGDLYGELVSADLGWPPVPDETPPRLLTPDVFLELRALPQPRRSVALRSFDAKLGALESPFAMLLVRRIEADLAIARAQGFTSGVDALLALRDGLPAGSARVAVQAARAHAETAREYATLRARAVGDPVFQYSSVWQSPPAIARRFTVAEANEIAIAALSPLGADYTTRLRTRLRQPWRHLPPMPNKRPEYATFFPIGGVPPFTVMTFRGTYGNARALTGAAALMMLYADIPADRAPDTRFDPAVLSNGAIYFGNILHDDYLLAQPLPVEQRIAYLIWALDRLWRQLFFNAVTMEFETAVEARVAAGAPPSGREVSASYRSILRHYYGSDAVEVEAAREWMTNGVAFATFEHHAWAPAMAMACALAEHLKAGDRQRVLTVLEGFRASDSDLSHDILRRAAIDLATPAPFDAAVRRMRVLMRALDNSLRERGAARAETRRR